MNQNVWKLYSKASHLFSYVARIYSLGHEVTS
jgi:hypothetical protein